jgi:hypothetical protein
MNKTEIQTTINKILKLNTKDRLRILFAEPSNIPFNISLPTPTSEFRNLYHELLLNIDIAIIQNNIDELKTSNLLEFSFDYGLLPILEKIIRYYSVGEIENARIYARSYDIFINKLNNVQPKRKGEMEKFINSYLKAYNNALTRRATVLSLSLPHKRRNPVPRLYPEIINNIISFNQLENDDSKIIDTMPKSLKSYVAHNGGKSRTRKNKTKK